jgi:hypothetical protein
LAHGGVEEFVDWMERLLACTPVEDGAGQPTNHLEVNMARDAGLHGEPGGKVPAAEVEGRADDEVWDLTHDLGTDEGDPVICFRLLGQVSFLLLLFILHKY